MASITVSPSSVQIGGIITVEGAGFTTPGNEQVWVTLHADNCSTSFSDGSHQPAFVSVGNIGVDTNGHFKGDFVIPSTIYCGDLGTIPTPTGAMGVQASTSFATIISNIVTIQVGTPVNLATITLSVTPWGYGTLCANGPSGNLCTVGTGPYDAHVGDNVTFSATKPNPSYVFDHFEGDGGSTTQNPFTTTLIGSGSVTAVFKAAPPPPPTSFTVTFHVKDTQTGTSIANANVIVGNASQGTDGSGNASFSISQSGSYNINVIAQNYQNNSFSATLAFAGTIEVSMTPTTQPCQPQQCPSNQHWDQNQCACIDNTLGNYTFAFRTAHWSWYTTDLAWANSSKPLLDALGKFADGAYEHYASAFGFEPKAIENRIYVNTVLTNTGEVAPDGLGFTSDLILKGEGNIIVAHEMANYFEGQIACGAWPWADGSHIWAALEEGGGQPPGNAFPYAASVQILTELGDIVSAIRWGGGAQSDAGYRALHSMIGSYGWDPLKQLFQGMTELNVNLCNLEEPMKTATVLVVMSYKTRRDFVGYFNQVFAKHNVQIDQGTIDQAAQKLGITLDNLSPVNFPTDQFDWRLLAIGLALIAGGAVAYELLKR